MTILTILLRNSVVPVDFSDWDLPMEKKVARNITEARFAP